MRVMISLKNVYKLGQQQRGYIVHLSLVKESADVGARRWKKNLDKNVRITDYRQHTLKRNQQDYSATLHRRLLHLMQAQLLILKAPPRALSRW